MVKNPPAMRETWLQSLDGEDPLEDARCNAWYTADRSFMLAVII